MASGWKRTTGNFRSFIGNAMGGLRGASNVASWVVAGTLAYYLWVKPSQDLKRDQQARASSSSSDTNRGPIPNPQETGLVNEDKSRADK